MTAVCLDRPSLYFLSTPDHRPEGEITTSVHPSVSYPSPSYLEQTYEQSRTPLSSASSSPVRRYCGIFFAVLHLFPAVSPMASMARDRTTGKMVSTPFCCEWYNCMHRASCSHFPANGISSSPVMSVTFLREFGSSFRMLRWFVDGTVLF